MKMNSWKKENGKIYYQFLYFDLGDYRCSGRKGNVVDTAYKCKGLGKPTFNFHEDIPIPPLEISVDYGDGSPIKLWTMENPTYVWGHEYTYGGTYDIKVHGKYSQKDFSYSTFSVFLRKLNRA